MREICTFKNKIRKGGKMQDGVFMFAKYAFAPNLLNLCGPTEKNIFLEILTDYQTLRNEGLAGDLKNLSLQFKAAIPYLKLIASENGIKDIFDIRVVEAYWLGNIFLNNVRSSALYYNLEERFRKIMSCKDWNLFKNSLEIKTAKPFHGNHVLNIYSRMDFNSSNFDIVLNAINNCSINYGVVKNIIIDKETKGIFQIAEIEYFPLEFDDSIKLRVGGKKIGIFYLSKGEDILVGDNVSLHWGYVCEKISNEQVHNLRYWTDYHLKIFNSINKE